MSPPSGSIGAFWLTVSSGTRSGTVLVARLFSIAATWPWVIGWAPWAPAALAAPWPAIADAPTASSSTPVRLGSFIVFSDPIS